MMLRLHLLLAVRRLKNHPGFTLINILGLSLGLTTFLLIVLYVGDEYGYDRFNTKADRIYRVNTDLKVNDRVTQFAVAAPPVAPMLANNYPEVEKAVRMIHEEGARFKKGDEDLQEERVVSADPELFEIFTLSMITGDPKTALQTPGSVVITETTARRYFNTTQVVGRTMTRLDDTTVHTVTGVIRDLPTQSHFQFDIFLSLRSSLIDKNKNFYALYPAAAYILLRPGANPARLQEKLAGFMSTWDPNYSKFDSSFYLRLSLTPLTDIHLRSNRTDELGANGNIQYLQIFSAIALFVLLIAAINFMNLSTARAADRAREVGVRKVLGSPRRQLVAQFLAESLLVTLAATLLSLLLTATVLPAFNALADKSLAIGWPTLVWLLPFIGVVIVAVGLLAGAYPAFFLSAFRPVEVLKGKLAAGFNGGALRSTLVVFQFAVSLFLIVGTLVIYRQLHYIQSKDLGFDRHRVLVIKGMNSIPDPVTLKKVVLRLPGVADATLSGFLPTNDKRWHNFGLLAGDKSTLQTQLWKVDADYLPTLDMHPVQGRNFSGEFGTDSTGLILNETAVRLFGIADDPLNKTISFPWYGHNKAFHTIGVVKDFNFTSLRENVTPLAMVMTTDDDAADLIVRTKTDNLPALLTRLKSRWTALSPHRPFEFSFMDVDFDVLYRSEQRMGQLSILFAALAIAIACLGLFGLAAYAAEQRTKEIGIRKVLGADTPAIALMLSRHFLRLIIIAILLASPLAWWLMDKWLQDFAYRIMVDVWPFVIAAAIVLLVAVLTTIYQSIRAAVANPVESLRCE